MNTNVRSKEPIKDPVTIDEIGRRANRARRVLNKVRSSMLAPDSAKKAPTFAIAQIGAICGMDANHIDYRIRKGDLPSGSFNKNRTKREFSLAELRTCARSLRTANLRPEDAEAIVIAVSNFKGGSTKTTSTMTFAQGLAMRGHRVLVLDCDPQGSLTTLFGILSDAEVDVDQTILPLCMGDEESIEYAIRPTYWDGIDLVPATSMMFSAEFALPARQARGTDPNFQFWSVLHYGLEQARQTYDVILIDTPPALSYITINAMMAADGLIMPLPPNSLDFASSVQFWSLFHDLAKELKTHGGSSKTYEFVDVLLTKVDAADGAATEVVRGWIAGAYGDSVLPIMIPKTTTAAAASAEFGSIYDMRPGSAHRATLKRAVEAYDQAVLTIETQIVGAWRRQLALYGQPAVAEGVAA